MSNLVIEDCWLHSCGKFLQPLQSELTVACIAIAMRLPKVKNKNPAPVQADLGEFCDQLGKNKPK